MRLHAWRETWMWLAVSACGAPAWMSKPNTPNVSVFDAPPLAGAKYIATVVAGDRGDPGPRIGIERGSFQCRELFGLLARDPYANRDEERDPRIERAKQTCDIEIAKLLREQSGFVFVVDGRGRRWLSEQEVLAAARPIDSPAKALLAVWVTGKYELSWGDGKHYYGDPEHGLVRAVAGGYEVIGSTSKTDSKCGGSQSRETVTNFRHTLFVDANGSLHERDKVMSHRYDIADPCHPAGRRPSDFADVSSGGTVRGYLLRAMHHEAESVRAFERIARELAAHGAPEELYRGANQATRDERDHATRCARLAGVSLAIAHDELPVRSLFELALDNACEGCVGEAYAALVATVQAKTALAPALRDHFAAIATDELAHAALAYAIAEWLDGKLTLSERARVSAARDAALRELATCAPCLPSAATRVLGLPSPRLAKALHAVIATAA